MDGETVVAVGLLNAGLLTFLKLLCPIDDNLLKLGTSQVAERRIFSVRSFFLRDGFFKTVSESLAKVREVGLVGKRADGGHDFLPVLEISVVYEVP